MLLDPPLVEPPITALNGSANTTTVQIVTKMRIDLRTIAMPPPPSRFLDLTPSTFSKVSTKRNNLSYL